MCSIAGSKSEDKVKKMLQTMKHRSPDDEGIVNDGKFCIGMGRLKIIDLVSGGLCPYTEGDLTLTFNGEIYNYLEIKEELIGFGYNFITNSDTEVLLKSYKQWGVQCLDKFNGMFAFAIYDGKEVFFARDIAGEKPFYYKERPFEFASEAKALGFTCNELPPAHYGIYDVKNNLLTILKWWEFKPIEIKDPEAELEALLEDSVRLRTRADVPYGLYLSEGIDSTLISTFHDFDHTFTYEDKDYSKEYLEKFKRILWHLDYPIDSFSSFGLWKLAEEASKKVKVVLSGEGADELFGGYVRYLPNWSNYVLQRRYPSYKRMFPVGHPEWDEFNGNLQELLRMGDRMSSAFGIENRCPFLDRRIIEFAFSLSYEEKYKDFEGKYILRKILKKRKPDYEFKEKHGLYCSVNRWMGVDDLFDKSIYLARQERIWQHFLRQ